MQLCYQARNAIGYGHLKSFGTQATLDPGMLSLNMTCSARAGTNSWA
jgi:hypothetical protein